MQTAAGLGMQLGIHPTTFYLMAARARAILLFSTSSIFVSCESIAPRMSQYRQLVFPQGDIQANACMESRWRGRRGHPGDHSSHSGRQISCSVIRSMPAFHPTIYLRASKLDVHIRSLFDLRGCEMRAGLFAVSSDKGGSGSAIRAGETGRGFIFEYATARRR